MKLLVPSWKQMKCNATGNIACIVYPLLGHKRVPLMIERQLQNCRTKPLFCKQNVQSQNYRPIALTITQLHKACNVQPEWQKSPYAQKYASCGRIDPVATGIDCPDQLSHHHWYCRIDNLALPLTVPPDQV